MTCPLISLPRSSLHQMELSNGSMYASNEAFTEFNSLIPLKRKLDISPVNGLRTFYIKIKTIECVKKQTMFQREMADFKGK